MPAERPLIGPIDAKSFTCWSHQSLLSALLAWRPNKANGRGCCDEGGGGSGGWSDLSAPNACRDDPGRQPPGPDGGRWSIHHHRRGRWPIDSLGGRAPTTQTWSMSHRPPKSVDDVTSSTFAAGWGCREGGRCPIEHVRGGGVVRWPGPEEKSGGESCGCFLLLLAVGVGLPCWRCGPRVRVYWRCGPHRQRREAECSRFLLLSG